MLDLRDIFAVTVLIWSIVFGDVCGEENSKYPFAHDGYVINEGCYGCPFGDYAYLQAACGKFTSFSALLQSTLMYRCDISEGCWRLGKSEAPNDNRFDFIVVGAGVAGPVIARRLSDNPKWRVLLVEAGPEEPTLAAVPGLAFNSIGTPLDWAYSTEPTQPNATACLDSDGKCYWPRGKMVGGSGAMNGMMYIRGHPAIFDTWSYLGNPGWSAAEVEKYFAQAENPVNPELINDKTFTQFKNNNPLIIDYYPHKPDFSDEVLKAAAELGLKTKGIRTGAEPGVVVAPALTYDGKRGNTARYYLRTVSKRPNLYVMINAQVTKILTSVVQNLPGYGKATKMAYGIELIDKNGVKRMFMALKEVIVSAGAIGSPHLLLLSGIGPADDLKKLNIPVVQDLPVGANLQNHVSVGLKMSIKAESYQSLNVDGLNEYLFNHTGPLSSTGLTQITAFLKTKYAKDGIPDIQAFFDGFTSSCVHTGLKSECSDGTLDKCPSRIYINARPTAAVTKSRGYMKLKSNNPSDHPLLYPNYFTNLLDLKILVEGIKELLKFMNTTTMKNWDLRLEETPHPHCSSFIFGSDDYWECYIRRTTGPENHQVGTCRMGPKSDLRSVVNHELRVYGVHNLRVADASIMPVITNANTMAPIIMIAEKAADMISTQWKKLDSVFNYNNKVPVPVQRPRMERWIQPSSVAFNPFLSY